MSTKAPNELPFDADESHSPGTDDPNKYDHSDHPIDRRHADDLKAPRGGAARGDHPTHSRGGVLQEEPVLPPDSQNSQNE